MKIAGLCSICERPGLLHTCALCGGIVCERHIDPASGTCARCRPHAPPGSR